jgi:hypothetical protein
MPLHQSRKGQLIPLHTKPLQQLPIAIRQMDQVSKGTEIGKDIEHDG